MQTTCKGTPKLSHVSKCCLCQQILHLPLPSYSPDYPKIKTKAVWKLTSPIVTKCPPRQRAESVRTAPTWTVPKPQCACLNPTETWSKVAWRNFPNLSPLKQTGQEERVRGKRKKERRREGAAGWPELARSLQRPTVLSIQVPLISLDSQTQAWAGAGVGKTAKIKS